VGAEPSVPPPSVDLSFVVWSTSMHAHPPTHSQPTPEKTTPPKQTNQTLEVRRDEASDALGKATDFDLFYKVRRWIYIFVYI
jgi:hypothetical protein